MSNPETQWKPGQSGNPKGRPPKTKMFSETARELLEADSLDVTWSVNGKTKTLKLKSNKTMHYGVASALIMEALKGNVVAARELIDRTEGKPLQKIEGDINGNYTVTFGTPEEDDKGEEENGPQANT